jgi:erythromycin esterase
MTDDTTATDAQTAGSDTGAIDWLDDDSLDPALVQRLSKRTVPLETTDPDAPLAGLAPLADRLRDVRVVGLGEATHGTREFFRLKHRILRLLVEQLDYRLFALEANFSETLAIDEYVVHGRGDPRDALEGIYFWTWDTEEVLALIEWLREFNDGRSVEDCVRFYGIDAQFTAGPAAALTDFLADRDPDLTDEHRVTLAYLVGERLTTDGATDAAVESRLADARGLIDDADDWFDAKLGDRGTGDGEADGADDADTIALHRRHLRALEQAVEVKRARHEEDIEALGRRRDHAMAENLSWILDHEPHDRVAVWAHDAHVQRDHRNEHWGDGRPMGAHLHDRYGDDYYALGFDFADGEFQAIGPAEDGDGRELRACSLGAPPADAATRLFAAVDEPVWFLDFDGAVADDRLADWFDAERAVRSVGAVYDPDDEHDRLHDAFRLPLAFDGLLFVRETERARPIERE